METVLLTLALPMHDPFAGTLVWGSAGLAAALGWAALIGIGLHALRGLPAPRQRAEAPRNEDWRDAA